MGNTMLCPCVFSKFSQVEGVIKKLLLHCCNTHHFLFVFVYLLFLIVEKHGIDVKLHLLAAIRSTVLL